jgi:hypothetical protein
VAAYLACAGSAAAHFPVSRGVALASHGSAAAVALPGFGVALRSDGAPSFAYVCDALLDVTPSDTPPVMSFAADGSLLVGSVSGLRSLDANGCPRTDVGGALRTQPIASVAVHPVQPNVVYAVTTATLPLIPKISRSSDGGVTWEQRASLVAADPVTALVLDPSDANVVYVTQATTDGGSLLQVSKDGGTSFTTITEQPGLTLLEVEPAGGDAGIARWWAMGRSATAMGNQGFSLFGAASPSGPWSSVLDVRFFGGFARDPGGALWVGDEAGGVYRSTDGGGSFTNVSSATGVSCLAFAQGALFGCTPGLTQQSTLVTWSDAHQAFDGVVALDNVARMPTCSAATDVATKCAAAWVEWQRDILMLPMAPTDAGTPPSGSGGAPVSTGSGGASGSIGSGGSPTTLPPETGGMPSTTPVPLPDASTEVVGEHASSGCSITASAGTRSRAPWLGAFAFGALTFFARVQRRRTPRLARVASSRRSSRSGPVSRRAAEGRVRRSPACAPSCRGAVARAGRGSNR